MQNARQAREELAGTLLLSWMADPPRAPGLVLTGDLNDELLHLLGDPLPARRTLLLAAIIFPSNKIAVPPKQRVRREDTAGIYQDGPSQPFGQPCQPHPLVIVE